MSPGLWSPCRLCAGSECFLSAQSNAAASSWPNPSAVFWASRLSEASPWIWRHVGSPWQGLPLQASRSWTVLKCHKAAVGWSVMKKSNALPRCETLLLCSAAALLFFKIWICISLRRLRNQLSVLFLSIRCRASGLSWSVLCGGWMNAAVNKVRGLSFSWLFLSQFTAWGRDERTEAVVYVCQSRRRWSGSHPRCGACTDGWTDI